MQPLTFACTACAKRVGVPAEFAGRKVRCPHCKAVVVAPEAAAPPIPPPPPAAIPDPVLVPPAPMTFSAPQSEGAESIFGEAEEEDDSLFAAPKPKLSPLPRPETQHAPDPIAPTHAPSVLVSDDNPFTSMSAAPAAGDAIVPEPSAPRPTKKPAVSVRPIPWKVVLIVILAGYSFLITVVAAIGWLR